ncbi:hypothetical protein GY45DRAFT_1103999 [Cubamyces sp. BRFM 1775]|nr:hypothetical protein GY45DRAFT_1103999 [Cubamyces sp. BRFM 1775]
MWFAWRHLHHYQSYVESSPLPMPPLSTGLLSLLFALIATTIGHSYAQSIRPHSSLRQHRLAPTDYSFGLFDIPLDWADPDAGQGRLHYGKYPASEDSVRQGTLFVTAADRSQSLLRWLVGGTAGTIHNSTGGKYDIVAWYPRGDRGDASVTVPGPAECFASDAERKAFYVQSSLGMGIEPIWGDDMDYQRQQGPQDARDWLRLQTKMIEHCLSGQNQTMLSYIGTAATVRDLVAMADAFDGPGSPVNFWGVGDDARIGAYLLQMFPERAGRIVLQAPPSLTTHTRLREDPFEVWREDVRHAHASMIKQFAIGLEALHCTNANGSPGIVSGLMRTLEDVRTAYVGWRNSLEVDLDNEALNRTLGRFFEQATSADVDTAAVANSVGSMQRSRSYGVEITDFRRMAVLCGDQLGQYAPVSAARVNRDMLSRIEQELDLAPLISTSMFPSLPYLCHLWPLRATERLRLLDPDDTPAERRTVAYPPLIVQYDMDPLSPPRPPRSIIPGIEKFGSVLQLKSGLHQTERFNPVTCIGSSISDYLRDGTIHNGRLCRGDKDISHTTGSIAHLHETPLRSSQPERASEGAAETWELGANVIGFVAAASFVMILANMIASRFRARGVIRLEEREDEGMDVSTGGDSQ